jgi:Protein of unknown function (DUF1501)
MHQTQDDPLQITRRYFLGQCAGLSLGAAALGLLFQNGARAGEGHAEGGLVGLPHFAPKAKRVIFLTQSGGPSQIELFDDKPGLVAEATGDAFTRKIRTTRKEWHHGW